MPRSALGSKLSTVKRSMTLYVATAGFVVSFLASGAALGTPPEIDDDGALGPGQRVAYLMLNLKERRQDVRLYVATLEEWLIRTLAAFNVTGERRDYIEECGRRTIGGNDNDGWDGFVSGQRGQARQEG